MAMALEKKSDVNNKKPVEESGQEEIVEPEKGDERNG
jgi:hypothetical protein